MAKQPIDLSEELKKTDSPVANHLLKSSLALLERSKSSMGRYYGTWDEADRIFRTRTIVDEADRKAASRREPTKILLPFTRAQLLTFVSFGFLQLNQRETFYEIQGTGREDQLDGAKPDPLTGQITVETFSPERDAETVLARETKKNKWNAFLNQTLLDVARFGLCCGKIGWEETTKNAPVTTVALAGQDVAGGDVPAEPVESIEPTVIKQGNKVMALSPYRFYPDTTLPLTRFQEGEFCCSEDLYNYTRLRSLEVAGKIYGLDHIKPLSQFSTHMLFTNSRFTTAIGQGAAIKGDPRYATTQDRKHGPVVISEMERWIIPDEFEVAGQKPFGDSKEPTLYIIWIGNWSRVLKCIPADYDHENFNYVCGQFTEDQHELLNEGLAELIGPLQETATWFINSHIKNVRQQLYGGLLAVDQGMVEMSDLQNRKPVIRLKPGALARGLDSAIKQIPITDSTSNHVNDVNTLWSFTQILSGASENAMGQYSGGRRDATQSRAVNQGAAARLKTVISVLWETFYEPCGRQMLCNAQQSLTFEIFQNIVGKDASQVRFDAFTKRSEGVNMDSYDFNIFDGTLPSEKGYIAQSLQDLLIPMLENPMGVQMLSVPGPLRSLLVELLELRNVRNPERFLPPISPTNAINIQQQLNQPTEPDTGGGVGEPPAATPSLSS